MLGALNLDPREINYILQHGSSCDLDRAALIAIPITTSKATGTATTKATGATAMGGPSGSSNSSSDGVFGITRPGVSLLFCLAIFLLTC